MQCPVCQTEMRPLFISMFCPNDRCGKQPNVERSEGLQMILRKLPPSIHSQIEQTYQSFIHQKWWLLRDYQSGAWGVHSKSPPLPALYRADIGLVVWPGGLVGVFKNRYGNIDMDGVPDHAS